MPVTITSLSNPQVRLLRSLQRRRVRRRKRLFLLEGVRLVEEALGAEVRPHLALYLPDRLGETDRGAALLERLQGQKWAFPTTEEVLAAVSDTATPQGIVAAVPFPDLPPRTDGILLVLDRVRDPGNCGTILRTAEAAGVAQVLWLPGTVDPFSPKVVRAAMGAHFFLPLQELAGPEDLAGVLAEIPQVLLAEARAGRPYDQVDWTRPTALIIGGEAAGAGPAVRARTTGTVSIPMAGQAESLNAAIACAILLFEALRQRRQNRSNGSTG